jgi:hypothetical protein
MLQLIPVMEKSSNQILDKNIKIDIAVLKKFDFEEDPFQDYRYEDLSMLSDPFCDNSKNDDIIKFSQKGNY